MANIIASGDYWRLEDDGTLYIYCVGDMPNYDDSGNYPPWMDSGTIAHAILSNSVTSIGNHAFDARYKMTSVTIPESVTSIGEYAFYDCESLPSVTIPDGVSHIGKGAFMACYALANVTIPGSVTSIGQGAFGNCFNLTSAIFSSGVTTIGDNMFGNCTALTSVTIPGSVISIESHAFSDCSALTSVTIPSSVTRIGEGAFGCDNLSDIYYNGTEAQWNSIVLFQIIGDEQYEYSNTYDNRFLAFPENFTIHYIPPTTYSVTFDANGGTGNMSAQTFTEGTAQELTVNAFTRTGYMFGGWNTAADGSGTAYADGASYTANADITLYAQWTQVVLSSIAITTPPAKTAYTAGETFDPAGMVVTATYSDGTTATVTGYSISPSGGLTTADRTITVSYTENGVTETETIAITVTAEPTPEPATLESIAITTPPAKTAYTVGETFDPSGMIVTASYSDASTAAVSDYSVSPSGNLATSDSSATVSYTENDVTKTAIVAITVTAQEPEMPPSMSWPRTALNVMKEIAARIGTPLDPRTVATLSAEDVEDTALKMTMKEVAGYIAAMNAGNWTITDEGNLYLVPLGAAQQAEADISAHNAESLSVSDPLEAWSGVRVIWDGEEWDASGSSEDGEIPVKSGDQIGFAGDESGRVLEIKVAFGQYAHPNPAHLWDRGAERILSSIRNNAYSPFEAQNVILDPACGIGDAVTVPGGTSLICSMSGELDGLCAVDASAPPDEAINTAYPANWQAASSGERVTGSEVEQIVTDAWNAASDG